MNFIPHTDKERREMCKAIGVSSIDELFKDITPDLKAKSFELPNGKSEFEVMRFFKGLANKNNVSLTSFLGAGFYDHYIPSAVESLSSKPEFYTAYTPYQPECSQGWLQSIFEFQTAICELTSLDVANASLYDGGTALYEAAMMAIRITGRKKIIVDSGVNLLYRSMLYTYTTNLEIEFKETPVVHGQSSRKDISSVIDKDTAAIILQNPNFFGAIDDHSDIVKKAHELGVLVIQSVYPVALGLIKPPGEMDVDIATGEGQSLGLNLNFGGPYLGFMAAKKQYMRKMPGRIVGETVDKQNKRGFVLTLQTREQHIRREKATSNICSNEALCALRAVIYLSLLGKHGFKELALLNHKKAEFAKGLFDKIKGVEVKKNSPTFNEFTLMLPKRADEIVCKLIEKGFICGFPLGRFYKGLDNYLLVSVTEKRSKEEIAKLADTLEAAL